MSPLPFFTEYACKMCAKYKALLFDPVVFRTDGRCYTERYWSSRARLGKRIWGKAFRGGTDFMFSLNKQSSASEKSVQLKFLTP